MNPYAPPTQVQETPAAPPKRTPGLTVLAVFLLVLGGLGLLSGPYTLVSRGLARDALSRQLQEIMWSGALGVWMYISLFLGLVTALAMIAAGVGILKMKPWGRTISLAYGLGSIGLGVVGQIMAIALFYPALLEWGEREGGLAQIMAMSGIVGGVVGSLFGLVLPVITLVVMTRPKVKAAFAAAAAAA
jgi:hypothetical protein